MICSVRARAIRTTVVLNRDKVIVSKINTICIESSKLQPVTLFCSSLIVQVFKLPHRVCLNLWLTRSKLLTLKAPSKLRSHNTCSNHCPTTVSLLKKLLPHTGLGIRSFALFSFTQNSSFKKWLWAIRTCRSLKNSDRESIAFITLYKRATMSELLSLLFKKEQPEWFACDLSKSLLKSRKKFLFLYVFHCFPPFYAQEWIAPIALCSIPLF